MSIDNRRTFLKNTGVGVATLAAGAAPLLAHAAPNNKIVMAGIGCGGQGTYLMKAFSARKNVAMAYVCDPDQNRADEAASAVEKISGQRPKVVTDFRKLLDDEANAMLSRTYREGHWAILKGV